MGYDHTVELAAQAAYDMGFMRHAPLDAPRWVDISDEARESWRVITRAVFASISTVPDATEMNRGFGNCPHCRAPRVAHCHECLNDIERDAAHAAGWRMDHLSGFGCIALCPDCRNDKEPVNATS